MNYQAIYNDLQLPEFAALTDAEFVAARNVKTEVRWRDVPMTDVLNLLIKANPQTGVATYDKLELATTDTAHPQILRRAIARFIVTVNSNIPVLNYQLSELVDYIGYVVMLGIITQDEATAFLDLSRVYDSPAEREYGADLSELDVRIARNQPTIAALESEIDALNQTLAVKRAQLDDARAGVV